MVDNLLLSSAPCTTWPREIVCRSENVKRAVRICDPTFSLSFLRLLGRSAVPSDLKSSPSQSKVSGGWLEDRGKVNHTSPFLSSLRSILWNWGVGDISLVSGGLRSSDGKMIWYYEGFRRGTLIYRHAPGTNYFEDRAATCISKRTKCRIPQIHYSVYARFTGTTLPTHTKPAFIAFHCTVQKLSELWQNIILRIRLMHCIPTVSTYCKNMFLIALFLPVSERL